VLLVYDYIPENSHQLISDLIDKENLIVKIVNTRKTKHGDFRKQKNGKFQITINKIDNKYRFLITLIHELAHFKVSSEFKYPTSPHGIEWKNTYKKMIINTNIIDKLENALYFSIILTFFQGSQILRMNPYDRTATKKVTVYDDEGNIINEIIVN